MSRPDTSNCTNKRRADDTRNRLTITSGGATRRDENEDVVDSHGQAAECPESDTTGTVVRESASKRTNADIGIHSLTAMQHSNASATAAGVRLRVPVRDSTIVATSATMVDPPMPATNDSVIADSLIGGFSRL